MSMEEHFPLTSSGFFLSLSASSCLSEPEGEGEWHFPLACLVGFGELGLIRTKVGRTAAGSPAAVGCPGTAGSPAAVGCSVTAGCPVTAGSPGLQGTCGSGPLIHQHWSIA